MNDTLLNAILISCGVALVALIPVIFLYLDFRESQNGNVTISFIEFKAMYNISQSKWRLGESNVKYYRKDNSCVLEDRCYFGETIGETISFSTFGDFLAYRKFYESEMQKRHKIKNVNDKKDLLEHFGNDVEMYDTYVSNSVRRFTNDGQASYDSICELNEELVTLELAKVTYSIMKTQNELDEKEAESY